MITIFFDGICEPVSPGGAGCFSWAIHGLDAPHDTVTACGVVGAGAGMSRHYAEWVALGKALGFLVSERIQVDSLAILSSSELLVNHLLGDVECRSGRLNECRDRCVEHLTQLGCTWKAMVIPRDQNVQAEHLARAAYLGRTGKVVPAVQREKARKGVHA